MRFKPKHSEHRSAMRHPCRKAAFIKLPDDTRIACTVVNVSMGGAGLAFDRPMVLPRRFRLQIPEDLFEGECEIRHRDGLRAGVMFVSNLAEAFSRFRDPPLAR